MTARSIRFERFLFHQKIFIFLKVTVDLPPIMVKTDATFHVVEILLFVILLRVSL